MVTSIRALKVALALPLAAIALMFGARAAMAETFVYVGNADSNDISVFRLDGNGEMTAVQTAPFAGIEKPGSSTPLAISPDKRVLIAGVRSQPFSAVSFAIDAKTGLLKQVGTGPLADSMAYVATDRSGKFLFSASYGGNKIAVNAISNDGVVGPPLQVIPTGLNAHAILAAPDNRFVFATNLGSDQVLAFSFNATTGELTPSDPPSTKVPEKSGPRHFVFHPNGKYVYLLHELNGDVAAFAYEAKGGAWDEMQRTTARPEGFNGKPWAADIHITPDGRFLYASERTTSTLSAFKVDPATGKLTTVGSVPTEKQPRGFNIDPSGRYLAAVGELSDSMTVYAIDQATGALGKLKSYPTGKKPNWVELVNLP
ncbi:beta-propeller fold lactonase family protein [Bradyrhizobium liaoningense]|uniref:lactonase family protein n=1 Tax=Bradyrhizobium liaoningense TaxID=43992 RepID=UPI001BA706D6|nr:beta-propeller fold lactonase family protein [Bradyrhizobium liaoningense]MBR0718545.1 beta-propeller fold lactonase family protein [Bradyrhizobium liaoningense]